MCRRFRLIVLDAVILAALLPGSTPAQTPFNQEQLKATHNSYACCGSGNSCPVKHHSPAQQVDDFGVWALELDFAPVTENGQIRFILGHDDCNDTFATEEWGYYLDDYLTAIVNAKAVCYRPTVIKLDKKDWDSVAGYFCGYSSNLQWVDDFDQMLEATIGEQNILKPSDVGNAWPSVTDLPFRFVLFGIGGHFDGSQYVFPYDQFPNALWSDEYELDHTFEDGLPPNPICVDPMGSEIYEMTNTVGKECFQPTDPGHTYTVSAQGTFALPFTNLTSARNRAVAGWTVLVRPGSYSSPVVLDKPMTLRPWSDQNPRRRCRLFRP